MCITLEESSDFSQIYYIATDICKKRTLTSKREGERETERERARPSYSSACSEPSQTSKI